MKERFEDLNKRLSIILRDECLRFLANNLKFEEDTSDIINLVLSGYISAMFNTMLFFSEEHHDIHLLVNKFIKNLIKSLEEIHPISKVKANVYWAKEA